MNATSPRDPGPKDPVDLLWLLIAYKNIHEVDDYIDHLDAIRGNRKYRYAICDNSPEPQESRHSHRDDVRTTLRPDNPGYLDGGLAALEAADPTNWGHSKWIALSNTDLDWVTGDPAKSLAKHDHRIPQLLAPRITEGALSIEKNPHVLRRRSEARLRLNRLLTLTKYSTLVYQSAALMRTRLGGGNSSLRRDASAWSGAHPSGTQFYSPYGAIMFFSNAFEPWKTLPRGVPLLAEEYFIAETARQYSAPVTYVPQMHVYHEAHTTTGPKVTLRRASGTSKAFREIYWHSRNRSNETFP